MEPITRKEMFLAKAAGQSVSDISPVTREEMFLQAIAESGGGNGDAGESTLAWKPTVDEDGYISWAQTNSTTAPETQNIRGPQGEKGATGAQGAAGVGVPVGGAAGQIIAKASDADYDTKWIDPPSSGSSDSALDVYTVGETVIGTWIDGKPLYRNVVIYAGNIASSNRYTIAEIPNIENFVNAHGSLTSSNYPTRVFQIPCDYYLFNYDTSTQAIEIRFGEAMNEVTGQFALYYTKTTDTATIELPDAAAMNAAYDEGVQSA